MRPLRLVILGLSITSSWGNGHAVTYRGLVRELARRGHEVLFLERDVPWYASNRDLPQPPWCRLELYSSLQELKERFAGEVAAADCVVVGSYVPEGVAVGEWVVQTSGGLPAFYDIDTPVTVAKLQRGDHEYLTPALIPRYGLYLSFTGGPTLELLEKRYGSPAARPLYCSADPEVYYPEEREVSWDLGYLGTYSADRQPPLERLLCRPASAWREGRFVVAGPQYPADLTWPSNVQRVDHVPPASHRGFYRSQRFTLNVTRSDMIAAGWSPSIRLFEAAACGVPIVSDWWEGLDSLFRDGSEILVARSSGQVLEYLRDLPEKERAAVAERGRARVLASHTAAHRALELEEAVRSLLGSGHRDAGTVSAPAA
ncbi:MAG TPA: glycosyltransferase [Verrucomicrobiae bacterium]|nr:glycosyltransferase [Verrucomicrobiae bacterium]